MSFAGLHGDHHVHSRFSDDAESTLAENVRSARVVGLSELRLVDHVRTTTAWVPEFLATVAALSAAEERAQSADGPQLIIRTGVESKTCLALDLWHKEMHRLWGALHIDRGVVQCCISVSNRDPYRSIRAIDPHPDRLFESVVAGSKQRHRAGANSGYADRQFSGRGMRVELLARIQVVPVWMRLKTTGHGNATPSGQNESRQYNYRRGAPEIPRSIFVMCHRPRFDVKRSVPRKAQLVG